VVDALSKNIPTTSSSKYTKTGPDGTAVASRKQVGGKTVRTGSFDKTQLKIPATDDVTVSGREDHFKQINTHK
jgi:hypothetical protein